jgi:hypothetical protein
MVDYKMVEVLELVLVGCMIVQLLDYMKELEDYLVERMVGCKTVEAQVHCKTELEKVFWLMGLELVCCMMELELACCMLEQDYQCNYQMLLHQIQAQNQQ